MKIINEIIIVTSDDEKIEEFYCRYRSRPYKTNPAFCWVWNQDDGRTLIDYLLTTEIPELKKYKQPEFWMKFTLIYDDKIIKISDNINNISSILKSMK